MKRVISCFLMLFMMIHLPAAGRLSKIDAFLQNTYIKYIQHDPSWAVSPQIGISKQRGEPLFHVFLKSSYSRDELAGLGIDTKSQAGDIFTAELTPAQLDAVMHLDGISYIEPAMKLNELMDVSTSSLVQSGNIYVGNNADSVQNMSNPYRGEGVICAVIDGGINFRHNDFKKNGLTRVLNIWDQTSTTLPHPNGYSYGREYTSTDINNGTCTATTTGHGNSCIAIMAGNGASSPSGRDMTAMAPDCDIICVKMTNDQETYSTYLQDGVAYVFEKATQQNKPAVVSISLGNNAGPHDGTSLSVQAIDNLCGAGRQVVVACGNSGTVKIHAEYQLLQNGDHIFQITTPNPITTLNPVIGADFWYEGSDSVDIYITPPGGTEMPVVIPQAERTDSTAYGVVTAINDIDDPLNWDNRAIIYVTTNGSTIAGGVWSIRVHGRNIQNGRLDGWSFGNVGTFTTASGGNDNYSLNDLASGRKTIAAAGYVGGSQNTSGFIYLGSMGPTRDGRLKPDLAGNQYVTVANYTGTDTYINLSSGTSWSAPHVGGAVALILQKQPDSTPEMILDILHQSAVWDAWTQSAGAKPNYRVGYGKLNVARAFKETIPVFDLTVELAGADIRLTWTAVSGASSYNIYRSQSPDSGFERIAELQAGTQYTDAGAAHAGRYFYYITTNTSHRSAVKSRP